jgi:hypothetical protein
MYLLELTLLTTDPLFSEYLVAIDMVTVVYITIPI